VIAVDTSALIAMVLREPQAAACRAILATEEALISAGTLAEALVVGAGRRAAAQVEQMVDELGIDVVAVTSATARRVAEHYQRWGKGFHPAGLNFGDCFAYALAKERGCPLLYVGGDFAKTDIVSALA
jgi:ribonuclease VapC